MPKPVATSMAVLAHLELLSQKSECRNPWFHRKIIIYQGGIWSRLRTGHAVPTPCFLVQII